MADKPVNRDRAPFSLQSGIFQAINVKNDESPKQAFGDGGAGVSPRFRSRTVGSVGQEPLAASLCSSPTSVMSPKLLHSCMSHADQPIFRSLSISQSELKKPLYGSGSSGYADLEAFLAGNDWDRDEEARPRIGAEQSPCLVAEQTMAQAATTIPVMSQQQQANVRPSSPHVPHLQTRSAPGLDPGGRAVPHLQTRSAPDLDLGGPAVPHLQTRSAPDLDLGARLDDALQRSDSCGIGSLDRLRLSGRMPTPLKSLPSKGASGELDTSTLTLEISELLSHAAPSSNPAMDAYSMQAGSADRMRRQSSPGLQSTADQKTGYRLSFTSQLSRLGQPATKTRRLSSPAVQSAGVEKPSHQLPSSSQQVGYTSATRRQSSPPRRLSVGVDLNPTLRKMSLIRPPSHQQPKARCQVDGCNADLSDCKPYVRRYQLCWTCMKSSEVFVESKAMRFCQQCSRLHDLSMFDGKKRSCRDKLIKLKQRRMAH